MACLLCSFLSKFLLKIIFYFRTKNEVSQNKILAKSKYNFYQERVKYMKLKLVNNHQYDISDASTVQNVISTFSTMDDVENLITVLSNGQNIDTISFYMDGEPDSDDELISTYTGMTLITPTLHSLNVANDKICVSFGFREKTEVEKQAEDARKMEAPVKLALSYLSDEQATTVKELFPEFESLIGQSLAKGFRLKYQADLYKTAQDIEKVQDIYKPGDVGTESLYTHIDNAHTGTLDDPIPAQRNMEYIKGKYYTENNQIYLMSREGMNDGESVTLQYVPSELVNNYFTLVQ